VFYGVMCVGGVVCVMCYVCCVLGGWGGAESE